MPHDNEIGETRAYPYTHFDCPDCGNAMEAEGDVSGETFDCDECGCKFIVRA